jgi:hypothetical protein
VSEQRAAQKAAMTDKPRMVLVTDPKIIAALMAQGKYRESLPFWTRQGDALWVEKKPATEGIKEGRTVQPLR